MLAKHGKKRTNCQYDHPAHCHKFIANGDLRGGCKKGNDCKYAHPKLCWSLKTGKMCLKPRCNFFHAKGTVFSQEFPQSKSQDIRPPNPANNFRMQNDSSHMENQNKKRRNELNHKMESDRGHAVDSTNQCNTPTLSDFLDLKQQMSVIQDQMRFLIHRTQQDLPPQTGAWNRLFPRQ